MEIKVTKTTTPKTKPDASALGFGKYFTDHMFVMDYSDEKGWYDARIIPYGPFEIEPACTTLHYGQAIFEGLKAYKGANGEIFLYRPERNMARINQSNDRLCIPQIAVADFVDAVKALVSVDKDWVPSEPDTSLYIRPFTIATEPILGVKASAKYQFIIICSPSGAYYAEGLNPVKIYVEEEFVRACPGGTGAIKCGGNYAASMAAGEKAHKLGYSQVLWLDGVERKYVEEVGAMNIMFKLDGEIYTAATSGTVLPGITRMSCIEVLKSWGYKVNEGKLAIDTVMDAGRNGTLEEVFGTGTAAVISPVGSLRYKDDVVEINNFEIGELTQKLYDTLTGIQYGKLEDTYGWTVKVD